MIWDTISLTVLNVLPMSLCKYMCHRNNDKQLADDAFVTLATA